MIQLAIWESILLPLSQKRSNSSFLCKKTTTYRRILIFLKSAWLYVLSRLILTRSITYPSSIILFQCNIVSVTVLGYDPRRLFAHLHVNMNVAWIALCAIQGFFNVWNELSVIPGAPALHICSFSYNSTQETDYISVPRQMLYFCLSGAFFF